MLHVITLYNRLLDDPEIERVPRVVIFAGKAASAYYAAKQIIRLINDVAKVINNDPRVHTQLKVVFIPNYGVSPRRSLSRRRICRNRSAGGHRSLRHQQHEVCAERRADHRYAGRRQRRDARARGEENIFIFGNTAEQVEELRRNGYNPHQYYEQDPELHRALTQIATGVFSPDEPKRYSNLFDSLVNPGITTSCWQITAATWIRRTRWTRCISIRTSGRGARC